MYHLYMRINIYNIYILYHVRILKNDFSTRAMLQTTHIIDIIILCIHRYVLYSIKYNDIFYDEISNYETCILFKRDNVTVETITNERITDEWYYSRYMGCVCVLERNRKQSCNIRTPVRKAAH